LTTTRKLVAVESPYNGPDAAAVRRHIRFARACVRDSLMRGEAPYASHLLYTQPGILDDRKPDERTHGIEAGYDFETACTLTAVYVNLGTSSGMEYGMKAAQRAGREIEIRRLPDNWENGEDPTREGW